MNLFFSFIITFVNVNSLIIKKNSRYLPSVPPSNDIKLLDLKQTTDISAEWTKDIVNDIMNDKKKYNNSNNNNIISSGLYEVENINCINDISILQKYFHNYNQSNNLFLGWAPRTKNIPAEILYIIVAEHNITNNHFCIKHLVQSPYWDSNQIESIYLKIALLTIVQIKNYTALNLSELYKKNIRYYLAWETWFLTYSS